MKTWDDLKPGYGLLFVLDAEEGEAPTDGVEDGECVLAGDTGLLVQTISEIEGPRTVSWYPNEEPPASVVDGLELQFDDSIDSPSGSVVLQIVNETATELIDLVETPTAETTRVRIWTNAASEPDKVVIAVSV